MSSSIRPLQLEILPDIIEIVSDAGIVGDVNSMSTRIGTGINSMELISSMSNMMTSMAVVGAMSTMVMSAMAVSKVSALGAAGFQGMTPGWGASYNEYRQKQESDRVAKAQEYNPPKSQVSTTGELAELERSYRNMGFIHENLMISLDAAIVNKKRLKTEYHMTLTLGLEELHVKYPKLWMTELHLRKAQQEVDRIELNMMLKLKKINDLRVRLHLKKEEDELAKPLTVMSKYNNIAKDVYGPRSENSKNYKGGYYGNR